MWRFFYLHQLDVSAYTDVNRLNYAACENVSTQITSDERKLIRAFVTSNLCNDAQTVRDMSAQTGIAEDYIWRVIKRVFRQTAITRGLWDAERMKLTMPDTKIRYMDEQRKQDQHPASVIFRAMNDNNLFNPDTENRT